MRAGLRTERFVAELVEMPHQMLASVADALADDVAAALEAEGAQSALIRFVEPDILGTQVLVHPADAGLGHLGQLTAVGAVVAEAQHRGLGSGRIHDEGAHHVGVRERINRRVRPQPEIEEPIGLPRGARERQTIGLGRILFRRPDVGPPFAAGLERVAGKIDQLHQLLCAPARNCRSDNPRWSSPGSPSNWRRPAHRPPRSKSDCRDRG